MNEQELSERLTIDQCARKLTALNQILKMWRDVQVTSTDPGKVDLANVMISETLDRIGWINDRATQINNDVKAQEHEN